MSGFTPPNPFPPSGPQKPTITFPFVVDGIEYDVTRGASLDDIPTIVTRKAKKRWKPTFMFTGIIKDSITIIWTRSAESSD